jgi:hypothetical protein
MMNFETKFTADILLSGNNLLRFESITRTHRLKLLTIYINKMVPAAIIKLFLTNLAKFGTHCPFLLTLILFQPSN